MSSAVKPFAVFINPKTLRLVSAYRQGYDYRLSFFGERLAIGEAYTASDTIDIAEDTFIRIHAPGFQTSGTADFEGVSYRLKGQGYGLILYASVALGATKQGDYAGCFSKQGDRSGDADKLWKSLVKKDLAEVETVEVEGERTVEENHCIPIPDRYRDLDSDGRIISFEICGDVDVEYPGEESEVNILRAQAVVESDFLLWAEGFETNLPPSDLLIRSDLKTREQVEALIKLVRASSFDDDDKMTSEEWVQAFLSRASIQQILNLPLPLEGRRKKENLPPVSSRTKRVVQLFRDIDD